MHALATSGAAKADPQATLASLELGGQCEVYLAPLAVMELPSPDFERVMKLAEGGDAQAMLRVADYYYQGDLVKKNFKKAMQWYRRAAEHGLPKVRSPFPERLHGWLLHQVPAILSFRCAFSLLETSLLTFKLSFNLQFLIISALHTKNGLVINCDVGRVWSRLVLCEWTR